MGAETIPFGSPRYIFVFSVMMVRTKDTRPKSDAKSYLAQVRFQTIGPGIECIHHEEEDCTQCPT